MSPERRRRQALFAKHEIKYVLAQFVDIHGAAKAKAVPVEHLDMVLTDGAASPASRCGASAWGRTARTTWRSAISSTLTPIPWMPGYARIVCNGHVHGKPYPYCSRVALQAPARHGSRRAA